MSPDGAGALSPFDILGKFNPRKRSSLFVIRTPHDQIPRSAETMMLDKPFETIAENLLIRFDCRERIPAITPDPNIPTENSPFRRGTNDLKSITEPVAMRAAVGIDEGNDITGRGPNSEVTRGTGSRL